MGSFAHRVVTFGTVLLNRKRTVTSLATAALLRRSAVGAPTSARKSCTPGPVENFRSSSKLPYEQHSRPLPSSRQRVRAVYLTGSLEAASLGRIRFRLSNRTSKYFEFLDVMLMDWPSSRSCGHEQTKDRRSTLETVAAAAGMSLATVPRCSTTELIVFTALDSPYSVEILRGVTSSPMESWCRRCRTLPTASVVPWTRLRRTVRGHHRRIRTDPVGSTHPLPRSGSVRVIDPAAKSPEANVATVGATNWAGGLAAVRHLLGLGHRGSP
jgi:hypothetical protein